MLYELKKALSLSFAAVMALCLAVNAYFFYTAQVNLAYYTNFTVDKAARSALKGDLKAQEEYIAAYDAAQERKKEPGQEILEQMSSMDFEE